MTTPPTPDNAPATIRTALAMLEQLQATTDQETLPTTLHTLGQTVDQYILGQTDTGQLLAATTRAQNAYRDRVGVVGTATHLLHTIVHSTDDPTIVTTPGLQQAVQWMQTEQQLLRDAAGQLADTLDLVTAATRLT